MLWLDATLATPLIGLAIQPRYATFLKFRDCLAPFCDLLQSENDTFAMKSDRDFAISIETPAGFTYTLSPDALTVRFRYRGSLEAEPGSFPQYKLEPSEPQPYSDLLSKTSREANRLLDAIVIGAGTQIIHRIGVMAFSRADANHLPPGISKHLEHLRAPWGTELEKCVVDLLVPIGGRDGVEKDRCHHKFQYLPADTPGEIEVTLDWQRIIEKGSPADVKSAGNFRMIENACRDALVYFEKVGDGTLWH